MKKLGFGEYIIQKDITRLNKKDMIGRCRN